jgi:phenylalanyl-tRNA synthetase beta chain
VHTSLCPRYSGILLDNITVQPSPQWLQTYLKNVGLRPVNNVVDITNFVLLEYGQPLHAFDADKIEGNQISVTTVAEGTLFVTLDEVNRTLSAEDLMICDAVKPICIAGVMGGLHTGVTPQTRRVFLESACFNPLSVRKTAQRHNLRTDAAQRFEKGADIHITTIALQRAVSLLLEHAGARIASDIIDIYPVPYHPYRVHLSYKKLDALAGVSIDKKVVKQILKKLEINITHESEEGLTLSVPLFKTDVQQDVDVIEEILRIYGYNRIPVPHHFKTSLASHSGINREQWKQKVSDILAGMGFYEILTNSIVHNKYATHYHQSVKLIKSANADLNIMRPSMLITGLETVAYNHNRRNFDLKFFEFGKTYHLSYHSQQPINKNIITETEHLFLITTGNIIAQHWHTREEKADFFYLKGVVENILNLFGIAHYEAEKITGPEYTYGLKIIADQKEIATIGCVDKKMLRQYDIEHPVYYADCHWNNLLSQLNNKQLKFKDISRYPWVRRDLALLIDRRVSFREIEKIAFREIKKVLKSVNLFDIYEDKRLGNNKKSYAVSFIFEDEEKTLKDEEVDQWMKQLMEVYKNELNAEIR